MANDLLPILSLLISVCSLLVAVFGFVYILQGRLTTIETDVKWIKHYLGKGPRP